MWYRLYELDESNRILKAASLEFSSDGEAMAEAQARAGLHGLEVWQEARCVGRVEPRRSEPAAAAGQGAAL